MNPTAWFKKATLVRSEFHAGNRRGRVVEIKVQKVSLKGQRSVSHKKMTFNSRLIAVKFVRFILTFGLFAGGAMTAIGQEPVQRVATRGDDRADQATPAAQPSATVPSTVALPFPPLSPAAQAKLQQTLQQWESQTSATKTLETNFSRWFYEPSGAPANIHSQKSEGMIKYAKPDKGLIRVDKLVFFDGMNADQPSYKEHPGQFGEYWVCTGTQLIEFDRSAKECKIQDLPPEMQGANIISSPLPFVFNLDAAEIQRRYWVRQVAHNDPSIIMIEAYPKRQEDLAQYKLVQIALDASTHLPRGLVMYAPNFDQKENPEWSVYEFSDPKRNTIGAGIKELLNSFVPEKPPADWKVTRDKFLSAQQAQ
jgi:TIGR03009 family protein